MSANGPVPGPEPAESCGLSPGSGFCHDSAESFRNTVRLKPREPGAHLNPARHSVAAAVTASLLIAGGFLVSQLSVEVAQAQMPARVLSGACESAVEMAVLASPLAP